MRSLKRSVSRHLAKLGVVGVLGCAAVQAADPVAYTTPDFVTTAAAAVSIMTWAGPTCIALAILSVIVFWVRKAGKGRA